MVTPAGYTLVTPSLDDIVELTAFISRWDFEVAGLNDFYEDDLRGLTGRPTFDPQNDWWALRTPEGIAALGMVWEADPSVRYSAFGIVDTVQRGHGLGSYILDLIEERLSELAGAGSITAHVHVDSKDPGGRTLVSARGFELVRKAFTMMKDIADEPEPQAPAGVKIANVTREELPSVHNLLEDAFSEHFGFAATALDVWMADFPERTNTSPDLWFKAEVDGELCAVSLCTINDALGWVSDLAVLKRFRSRGIAKALLRTSFHVLETRGCKRVGLGVDASNETGAVQLYESVGMTAARVYETYLKGYGA